MCREPALAAIAAREFLTERLRIQATPAPVLESAGGSERDRARPELAPRPQPVGRPAAELR